MLKHELSNATSNATSMLRCKARTYGRTYVQLLTLGSYLTLGNARRGAAKFSQFGDENSRSAAAPRQAVTHA